MRAPGGVGDELGGAGVVLVDNRPTASFAAMQEDLQRRQEASFALWKRNHASQLEHYEAMRPEQIAAERDEQDRLQIRFIDEFKKRAESKSKDAQSTTPMTANGGAPPLGGGGHRHPPQHAQHNGGLAGVVGGRMPYPHDPADPLASLYGAATPRMPANVAPPNVRANQERKRKNATATAVPPAIANGYNLISPPALYDNTTNGFAGGAHGGPARMMGHRPPTLYMTPTGYPMLSPLDTPGTTMRVMQSGGGGQHAYMTPMMLDPEMTMGPDADVTRFEDFIPRRAELPILGNNLDAYLGPDIVPLSNAGSGAHQHHLFLDQPSTSSAYPSNPDLRYHQTSPGGATMSSSPHLPPNRPPSGAPGISCALAASSSNVQSPSTASVTSSSSISSGGGDHQLPTVSSSFAGPTTTSPSSSYGSTGGGDSGMEIKGVVQRLSPHSYQSPLHVSHSALPSCSSVATSRSQSCDQPPSATAAGASTTQPSKSAAGGARKRANRVASAGAANPATAPGPSPSTSTAAPTPRAPSGACASRASSSGGGGGGGLPQPSCVISTYPLTPRAPAACGGQLPQHRLPLASMTTTSAAPAAGGGNNDVYLSPQMRQQQMFYQQPGGMPSQMMMPLGTGLDDRLANGANVAMMQQHQQRIAMQQQQQMQMQQMRHTLPYAGRFGTGPPSTAASHHQMQQQQQYAASLPLPPRSGATVAAPPAYPTPPQAQYPYNFASGSGGGHQGSYGSFHY